MHFAAQNPDQESARDVMPSAMRRIAVAEEALATFQQWAARYEFELATLLPRRFGALPPVSARPN